MKVKFGNMKNKKLQAILRMNEYIIHHGEEIKICEKMVDEILVQFLSKQIVHDNKDDLELDYAENSIKEKFLQLMLLRVFGV